MESIFDKKPLIIIGTFILTSVFILLEHYNGGIITHHLLAREDLPGISNLWGLLSIPLLTWLSIALIGNRRNKISQTDGEKLKSFDKTTWKGFLAALLFGISASLLWEFNFAHILQYFILLPVLIAFFKPVYMPQHLLGFVIGMLFTFGGILPILFGTVLLVLCFLVNKVIGILKSTLIRS